MICLKIYISYGNGGAVILFESIVQVVYLD